MDFYLFLGLYYIVFFPSGRPEQGKHMSLLSTLHSNVDLSYLIFRKGHEDKMCGGDGGEPDYSASNHGQSEQRRPPVSPPDIL